MSETPETPGRWVTIEVHVRGDADSVETIAGAIAAAVRGETLIERLSILGSTRVPSMPYYRENPIRREDLWSVCRGT